MTTRPRATSRRPVQRISGPAELLQAVPYLIGFHPAESLVLVGLRSGRLVVTARLDLVDAAAAVPHTLAAIGQAGSTSVLAIVYDDDADPGRTGELPWGELVPILQAAAERGGCAVGEVLFVSGGRWWSYTCTAPDCCPPGGRELPSAPSAFAAAATYDGVMPLPSRAALEHSLDPAPDAERQALQPALVRAEQAVVEQVAAGEGRGWERSLVRALFNAARLADQPGWPGSEEQDVARFGVALRTIAVRDAVWLAVDDGRLDGRPLWRELGRRLPAPHDAPPLFLYGWAAWRAGNGTMAGIAAERALLSDPQYVAADLLVAAVMHAIDPRRVPKLRQKRLA